MAQIRNVERRESGNADYSHSAVPIAVLLEPHYAKSREDGFPGSRARVKHFRLEDFRKNLATCSLHFFSGCTGM